MHLHQKIFGKQFPFSSFSAWTKHKQSSMVMEWLPKNMMACLIAMKLNKVTLETKREIVKTTDQ